MKYIVRLNPKAINPLTLRVTKSRVWEVEQCASVGGEGRLDSEKCIWHCEDVRIDSTPIRELFVLPKEGEPKWEKEFFGICVRGQDNAIEIKTGACDVSGH